MLRVIAAGSRRSATTAIHHPAHHPSQEQSSSLSVLSSSSSSSFTLNSSRNSHSGNSSGCAKRFVHSETNNNNHNPKKYSQHISNSRIRNATTHSSRSRSTYRSEFKAMVDRLTSERCHLEDGTPFHPKKILILTKFTRLDYEKAKDEALVPLNDKELLEELVRRGFDRPSMIQLIERDAVTGKATNHLISSLRAAAAGHLEVKCVNRFEYTNEAISWADLVITSGGDGTFLMAASKINGCKPLIGFNSDPSRSVGHLLLPGRYTTDFPAVISAMNTGKFYWMKRHRIRTTLHGRDAWCEPLELHQQQMNHAGRQATDLHAAYQSELQMSSVSPNTSRRKSIELENPSTIPSKTETVNGFVCHRGKEPNFRTLPILALNEVFIGESLSGRVSYIDLAIGPEGSERVGTKSSGLAICTGTGSTSWSYNINKINGQIVSDLLEFTVDEVGLRGSEATRLRTTAADGVAAQRIADRFNAKLVFDPTEAIMQYTLRDPVILPKYLARGRTGRIEAASHMQDACVVIDGGPSYSFNTGTSAVFEINPADAIVTIKMPE